MGTEGGLLTSVKHYMVQWIHNYTVLDTLHANTSCLYILRMEISRVIDEMINP